MHAYSLAAALADVRHRGSNTTMHQTLRRADQGAGAQRRAAPGRARALLTVSCRAARLAPGRFLALRRHPAPRHCSCDVREWKHATVHVLKQDG